MINLKAELFRKQEEVRQQKQHQSVIKGRVIEKKPSVWTKANKGVQERAASDQAARAEQDDAVASSRAALEAKAKLYDSLQQGRALQDEELAGRFLVDFEQKAVDHVKEEREKRESERQQAVRQAAAVTLDDIVPPPDDPADEWVDFVDCQGRSRRCLKRDLAALQDRDKQLRERLGQTPPNATPHASSISIPPARSASAPQFVKAPEMLENIYSLTDTSQGPAVEKKGTWEDRDLMSEDMRREMMREKWEREEQELDDKGPGPLHYSNVQFDEVRQHGVAYYQFSKDDAVRKTQIENLQNLRKQSQQQKKKLENAKTKRQELLKARLAKVKQRRTGKGPEELDLELEGRGEEGTGEKKEEEPQLLQRDENLRATYPLRDWDVGKDDMEMSWSRRKEDLRKERVEEFAPPPSYSGTGPSRAKRHRQETPPPQGEVDLMLDPTWIPSSLSNTDPRAQFEGGPSVDDSITTGLRHIRNNFSK